MIRTIASRVTGTAFATGRFAIGIPLGVARSVLSHVPFVGGDAADEEGVTQSRGDVTTPAQQAPQPSAQEQAAEAVGKTGGSGPRSAPAAKKSSTPKAGDVPAEDDGPAVVLSIDSPPEEIEPPVDVVGEALKAEQQQVEPPAEVEDEHPVVYSTSSDES